MRVQMLVTISGGRADGSAWPEAGSELDLGDQEGADLCRARLARPVAVPVAPAETTDGPSGDVETRSAGGGGGGGTPAETHLVVSPGTSRSGNIGDSGESAAAAPPDGAPALPPQDHPAGPPQDAQPAAVERPAVNAPKVDWVAHAVSQGHDSDAAAAMTKAELLAQYGPQAQVPAASG